MRETSNASPNPAFRSSDPGSIGYKHFIRVGKIGKCSLLRLVLSAGLSNAGAGLMAALLFSVRRIIELESGMLDTKFLLMIFQISSFLIISEILFFLSESIDIKHGMRVLEELRLRIFSHLVQLPLPLLQKKPIGEWIARCDNDVRVTQQGIFSLPRILIAFPISFLIYMGAIFKLSQPFALVVFVGSILGVFPAFLLRRRLLSISSHMMQQIGDLTGRMGETFLHIKTIKSFCGENASIQSIKNWSQKYITLAWRARLMAMTARQASTLIMTGCFIVIAFIGRSMIQDGTQTLSELVPVLVGVVLIARELRKVSGMLGEVQNYRSAIKRYLDSLSETKEILEPGHPRQLPDPIPDFTFKNITFSYGGQGTCLKHIDFHVKRGETLSIVGLSGAGKSTLIELILGFVEPQEGAILVDGKPLHEYSLKHWRKRIGAVFQPPALFQGTVKENLGKFALNTDQENIQRLLDAVGLEHTIQKRKGLDNAAIAENATNWSEGEAQRLVFVRALLMKPDILLLDEATSALDAKSEEAVVALMQKGAPSRITLIITHRMSLAIKADTVLALGESGVEGIGTPENLYSECPLFRYMCMAQRIVPPETSP